MAKIFYNSEVFFLTDEQQDLLNQALDAVGVEFGELSKARRRTIALVAICAAYLAANRVSHEQNKLKCSADI